MRAILRAAAAIIAVTAACSPIYVDHNFADYADWSQYKTYHWLPLPESDLIVPTPAGGESSLQRFIRLAIERELAAKGLSKVPNGGDLGVRYALQSELSTEVSQNFSLGVATTRVDNIKTGYLLIQLLDERQVVMWEGVAENSARQDAPMEQRNQAIDKAVEKLFRKYPPN